MAGYEANAPVLPIRNPRRSAKGSWGRKSAGFEEVGTAWPHELTAVN